MINLIGGNMPLSNAFYIEVFAKEQKWIELIDKGLLNSISCMYELKPFYLEKKKQLEEDKKIIADYSRK